VTPPLGTRETPRLEGSVAGWAMRRRGCGQIKHIVILAVAEVFNVQARIVGPSSGEHDRLLGNKGRRQVVAFFPETHYVSLVPVGQEQSVWRPSPT